MSPGDHSFRPSPLGFARGTALFALLACASLGSGCAPKIGDECKTALDCSASGTRICDRTQAHGYCTLQGCEEGTCPVESVCVKFRGSKTGDDRLATSNCMLKCSDSSDCRDDQGYRCLHATNPKKNTIDPTAFGDGMEAEVLGNPNQKFCAVRTELPDAGL